MFHILHPTNGFLRKKKVKQGISENLIRFSVGIENVGDLKLDISQALKKSQNES